MKRQSEIPTSAPVLDDVMACAIERLLAQLPEVVDKVVSDALDGNAAACKLVLDIAGMKEQIREALQEERQSFAGDATPLQRDLFEAMCRRVAALPDQPDPNLHP